MHLRVHPVRATSVLAVGSVLAGCGGAAATATAVHPAAAVPATPAAHATAVVHTASRPSRIDAVTAAAKRLYSAEVHGTHALDTRDGVGSDPKLLALLGSGNMAAVRAYVTSEYRRVWYHWHVSYLSITRGSQTVMNIGVPFVMPGPKMTLRGPGGRVLGTLRISMQDEIGFVRLMRRIHPTVQVVVRGRGPAHLRTSLSRAASARLPLSGSATIGGHHYLVRSFHEVAWGGEPVTIWILARA
jgi:hypothetical protein